MITVVNVKRTQKGVHYVGRAFGGWAGSALQNQWRGRLVGGKEQAINLYRNWLAEVVKRGLLRDERSPAWLELKKLALKHKAGENICLGCWCAPAACHAEVVKETIEYLVKNNLV